VRGATAQKVRSVEGGAMTDGARPARRPDALVGRADELESLGQLLDGLDQGDALAVELLGEPGIGKTRRSAG